MTAKATASVIIWITYLGMVAVSMTQGALGRWSILLAFVLMIPLIVVMGMMWGVFQETSSASSTKIISDAEIEKRKRDRLDRVLRDLSDDDLVRLKNRLSDGTLDDDKLYNQLVGDDGELVDYSG